MFVKPNQNAKYAAIKEGQPGHEPERVQLKVYDPERRDFLPAEGRDVGEDNALHWHRRAEAGEVTFLSAEDGAKSIAEAERARAGVARKDAAKAKGSDTGAGSKTEN